MPTKIIIQPSNNLSPAQKAAETQGLIYLNQFVDKAFLGRDNMVVHRLRSHFDFFRSNGKKEFHVIEWSGAKAAKALEEFPTSNASAEQLKKWFDEWTTVTKVDVDTHIASANAELIPYLVSTAKNVDWATEIAIVVTIDMSIRKASCVFRTHGMFSPYLQNTFERRARFFNSLEKAISATTDADMTIGMFDCYNSLPHECDFCNTTDSPKICGDCKFVRYCSIDCQRKAWNRHKHECSSLKSILEKVLSKMHF